MVKNWKEYPGRNKFICNGAFITGPERGAYCVTMFLIIIPLILYFIFVASNLVRITGVNLVIVWIVSFLGGMTLASLTVVHCMDPGILPRSTPGPDKGPLIKKEVLFEGTRVTLRYCTTCHIYRPPRAFHCRDCDNCVEVLDHHCPWTGNCVAKRNYRFFVVFLASVTALAYLIFASSLGHLIYSGKEEDKGFLKTIADFPISFVLSIYAALVAIPVSCLSGYHIYIVSNGETTIEQIKKVWHDSSRENTSCLQNWQRVLFGDISPSRLYSLPMSNDRDSEDGEARELLELSRHHNSSAVGSDSMNELDLESGGPMLAPVVLDAFNPNDGLDTAKDKNLGVQGSIAL